MAWSFIPSVRPYSADADAFLAKQIENIKLENASGKTGVAEDDEFITPEAQ